MCVYLLAAKARVAPLKQVTIPRLELLAATIGARLYTSVKTSLSGDFESFFWTDSSTVLSWIKRKEEWSTFVWNRVSEIRDLTSVESWRHVPGSINPADCPSRGCSPKQLLESQWWEGPKWLYSEAKNWPVAKEEVDDEEVVKERRKRPVASLVNKNEDVKWKFERVSKYPKILRAMAWILRFLNNVKPRSEKKQGELSGDEVERAEKCVFKIVQSECFVGTSDTRISALEPFLDEHRLIRAKTRVFNRLDSDNFRFPIILPAKHIVIERLISHLHEKNCHVGTQGLLCICRERFWILGGRRTVRAVISKCVKCKRHGGKPVSVNTPPLPIDRVKDAMVFEVSGVDFAGPLYLKGGEKAWVCLFTCAVYRAVHLELTTSLSTSSFISVLRRFIARRGRPKTIYSDNGTNFVGAENALSQLDWQEVVRNSSIQRITWKFNPPSAPWWGGFWERLIGMIKRLLKKMLGRASLDYEDLLTVLCDCEAVVNSRPLTYISSDVEDLAPLTPSMFLREQADASVQDLDMVDRSTLKRAARRRQRVMEDLRRRFRTEYLGALQPMSSKRSTSVKVGDVVLIGNEQNRLKWPMGRVIEIIPGKDGIIRLVRIGTSKGQLLRPVQKIYPLESAEIGAEDKSNELADDKKDESMKKEEENECGAEVNDSHKLVITKSGRVSRKSTRFCIMNL